jgi:hypothetical protein
MHMPGLFDPFAIRDLTFTNRVFVSPMCQYSSHDGFANDWHLVHLGSLAVAGAGLVLGRGGGGLSLVLGREGGGKSFRTKKATKMIAAHTPRMMTQGGTVVVGGIGVGGGDWAQDGLAGRSSHEGLPGGGLPQVSDGGLPDVPDGGLPQVPDGGLLGGWFHAGWPDGAGVNWRGLTCGSCPASGTALPTEKTIARRTQLTRQPRLVSQDSLRLIDAFTLNQECYSSGKFSGKNILNRSPGIQSSLPMHIGTTERDLSLVAMRTDGISGT